MFGIKKMNQNYKSKPKNIFLGFDL